MATALHHSFSYFLILIASLSIFLVVPSSGFDLKMIVNATDNWIPGVATWYGPAHGDGSEGGACGYGNAVGQPPFSAMISAGNSILFNSGKGCGACYEVMCIGNSACSGKPVRVVITDLCPGSGCLDVRYHFDLSGIAFGAMAFSGQDEKLRKFGRVNIQHRRVACNYPRTSIAFRVDPKSSQYYFATAIEYVNGDGDLTKVELKEAFSASWYPMQQSWGAVWKLNKGPLRAPFSFRLTTLKSGRILVANNAIPAGWKPGQTYRSLVNYR